MARDPHKVPVPLGTMNMVDLARWAALQCNEIADEGGDPVTYHPVVRAHYLLQAPRHCHRDRDEQLCFLNGVLVE